MNLINSIISGVDLKHSNITKNRKIWKEFMWYIIYVNCPTNIYYPLWFQILTYKLGHLIQQPPLFLRKPFVLIRNQSRKRTGGRGHRCEFTDKNKGALYGGQEGAFMEKLFQKFIDNLPKG